MSSHLAQSRNSPARKEHGNAGDQALLRMTAWLLTSLPVRWTMQWSFAEGANPVWVSSDAAKANALANSGLLVLGPDQFLWLVEQVDKGRFYREDLNVIRSCGSTESVPTGAGSTGAIPKVGLGTLLRHLGVDHFEISCGDAPSDEPLATVTQLHLVERAPNADRLPERSLPLAS